MGKIILLVGLGGFIGGIARHLVHLAAGKVIPSNYPFDTLIVNIIGCFMIGIFYAWSEKSVWITPEWRFFLLTGLCGGFTTFSAFSLESMELLKNGQYLYLGLYIMASVVLGIAATFGGVLVVRG